MTVTAAGCACCRARGPLTTDDLCVGCDEWWRQSAAYARIDAKQIPADEALADFIASGICPHRPRPHPKELRHVR